MIEDENNDNFEEDINEEDGVIVCPICSNKPASIRFMEASNDLIAVAWICSDCFKNIKPKLEKDSSFVTKIIEKIRASGALAMQDIVIKEADPELIKGLMPGIYKLDSITVDDFYKNLMKNPEEYLEKDADVNFNKKLNVKNKNLNMIESLIDKRLDKVKNTKDNIRADIRQKKETILNPALIFRPSNLQERCDKCGSTLESFLRQITAGCSYCFVNFSKYLDEYIESVKMSMKTEEKNNDEKERTYVSTKKQIEILEIVKQEAIAQQNWTRAAECRDSILALNKKKKKGKKNAN